MSVVVLRPLGLGDFLTGVPAYRAIARAFPADRRIFAGPAALKELVMLSGAFDELVETEPLAPLPARLARADVAIDLHGRGPASQRVLLAGEPARLISFACDEVPETQGSAPWRAGEHEVARWCRMLAHAGIPADPGDLALRRPASIFGAAGASVVHPGAASASRRWPADRFAAIVREERRRGRRVLVTGSPLERALGLEVAARAGLDTGSVLAGMTSPLALAAVVAHAARVISGDTGVAHLAYAFATPSVTLFGPTAPATWGPPARPEHRVLWAGRTGDPHGDTLDPGLAAIAVGDVLAELAALDQASRPSPTVRESGVA